MRPLPFIAPMLVLLAAATGFAPAAERGMPLTDFGLPAPAPTPVREPSVCGNGLLEDDETCESCPADCVPAACKSAAGGERIRFAVDWQPPFGVDASSLTVVIGYRSSRISLPGSGTTPKLRLDGAPVNAIVVLNDMDYAVKVVLAKSGGLAPGQLFTLEFDRCDETQSVEAADLSCRVSGCASAAGDIAGCTCAVQPL